MQFNKTLELENHFGCVNAAFLSQASGGTLLTGGDDSRIHLYRGIDGKLLEIESDYDELKILPNSSYLGHISNIFSLGLTKDSQKIYSCGNDGFLITSHVETGQGRVGQVRLAHEDSILKLSIQPENNNIVLTASQDYTIKLWDDRVEDSVGEMMTPGLMNNYVEFNPTQPNIFVSSNDRSGLYLRDLRTCFSSTSGLGKKDPLVRYATKLLKTNQKSIQISKPVDITSAKFSPDGKMLCANIQKYYPILYDLVDKDPIAILKDPSFSSLATIKNGDFSDALSPTNNDLTYFAGSDNHSVYGWKIPSLTDLYLHRKRYWPNSLDPTSQDEQIPEITILSNQTNLVPDAFQLVKPKEVHCPTYTFATHESVVNTVVCHPTLPIIVTAGVEKTVRLWSPYSRVQRHLTDIEKQEWLREKDARLCKDEMTLFLFKDMIDREKLALELNPSIFWSKPMVKKGPKLDLYPSSSSDASSSSDDD